MSHFLQSKYWREIKDTLGNQTFDFSDGWFQTTTLPLHKKLGYVPRVDINNLDWESLYNSAKDVGCTYVTVDPINEFSNADLRFTIEKIDNLKLKIDNAKPVHLQHNVIVNLDKPEEQLLEDMDRKYRYNVRLAEKKGVKVWIGDSDESFEVFLKIYLETKSRQNFYGRGESYLRTVWQKMKEFEKRDSVELCKIAIAFLDDEPLVAWMIFLYDDVIYYPYGGSRDLHRELKPTYLIAWEVFKWARAKGFKSFDFWGIEEDYQSSGFSNFKIGFGGKIVKYSDSINLVIDKKWYKILKLGMVLREKLSFIKKNT